MDWQEIGNAPTMRAILIFHEYYSHGQVRHGWMDNKGNWQGVNADGTAGPLYFQPTLWMNIPAAPGRPRSSS